MSLVPRLTVVLFAAAFLAAPGCRFIDVPLWGPGGRTSPRPFAVDEVRNVAYHADDPRQRLDLFVPKGCRGYPVIVLVHGGAWMFGDKSCCGLYSAVGDFLASQGVGVVLPNYRLSPGVKHPEHVRDVARAVAWTKAHIGEHGGDPGRLFLAGHSAGGHLVALLATDDTYLKAEGLGTEDVKGVVAISGVYRIPAGDFDTALGGVTPRAFRISEGLPPRGDGDGGGAGAWLAEGLPVSVNLFGPVFGDDVPARADASPLNHVRLGLPPFLLLNADTDLPTLPRMAEEFGEALRRAGGEVRLATIRGRNHNSIMFRAIEADDPAATAMLDFVRGK